MKKTHIFISILLLITLSMTSCTVNWFGDTYDAPWYCIAILFAMILVCGYFILMSKTYICPHCKTEFKAKPYQLSVMVHMGRKRLARCPRCGKLDYCMVKRK